MQSALWRLDASPAVSDHPEVRFRLHEAQPGSKYTRSAVFDRSSFSVSLVGLHTGQLKKKISCGELMLERSHHLM